MVGFRIFCVAILAGLIELTSGSCSPGMFGDSCSYSCHCGESCNETTGSCSDPCDSGWIMGGRMCQKQNIALNKTASTTSGVDEGWSPSNAVDGDNDTDGEDRTCFHALRSPSDWTVDLGRDFQLYDIRIYSRNGSHWRNANSTIYLNNTTNTTTTNCSTLPSSSNTTTSQTDVTCNGTGRYVTIKNLGTGPGENDTLNICEVEIYVCSQNLYGKDCDSFCHCLNSTCDRWTGLCPGDCRAGWQGQRCDTACNNTTYGINCNETCAGRKCSAPNSSSDRHTGACDTGCLPGWTGADGTQAPISGTDHDFLNITLPLIVVSTVAGVLVVLVLALVVLLIRRHGKQKQSARDKPDTDKPVKGKIGEVKDSSKYVNLSFEKEETVDEPSRKNPEERAFGGIQSKSPRDVYTTVNKKSARGGSRDRDLQREVPQETDDEDHNAIALVVQVEDTPDVPGRNYYNTDAAGHRQVIPLSQPQIDEQMKSAVEGFYRLPEGFVHSYSESQHPRNKGKNRFKGYYPYDYNRVVLHDGSESTRGDYINASYIDGYKAEKRYIAAQGPYRPEVVVDFWRMIYQEQCATVVMLTELVETGKMKCLQYWPEQGSLQFGEITVTMETETRLANYKITRLSLQKEKEAKVRHLNHFQFTGWPDDDAPDTSAFLEFMWRVKGTSGVLEHPTVIHCSAGVGRTGTYIAIESLVDQAAVEGKADVVSFISSMRGQRKNMIRTKEQYLFLHQVVDMAVSEGDTSLDSDMIIQTDLSHVSEVTMGNKNVQQHLEVLEKEREEGFKRDPVTTLSSHKSKNGFVVLSSQDKEEVWSQVYKSDSRILITWAADKPVYLPSTDSPITTARIEACMRGSTIIADDVLLNTVELTAEDTDGSTLLQHYHLTGSTRNQSVTLLIDSLLTRLNDQQQCSCTVVSQRMSAYVWSSPSDDWNLQFMSTHKNIITFNRCIIST